MVRNSWPGQTGCPGEHDYLEKSQPGQPGSRHRNAGISDNRAEIFPYNRFTARRLIMCKNEKNKTKKGLTSRKWSDSSIFLDERQSRKIEGGKTVYHCFYAI